MLLDSESSTNISMIEILNENVIKVPDFCASLAYP